MGTDINTRDETLKKRYDVLIIEDNLQQAQITQRLMEAYGLRSQYITDSTEALIKIEHDRPAVVIMDLLMPKLDGLRLLRAIRSSQKIANTKIIIYSGKNYESDRRKALELGADAFFFKPTRANVMVETVKKLMAGDDRKPSSN